MSYAFGDSSIAARRLEVLASVFEPSTKDFLQTATEPGIDLVLDLGCGPGLTTRLLFEVVKSRRAVGLDNSRDFIEIARKKSDQKIQFVEHDITDVPFPVERADLIFCRFLLTHLVDVDKTLRQWGTQMKKSGLLLVEEVEGIQIGRSEFGVYLSLVESALSSQQNKLYIGGQLDQMKQVGQLKQKTSRVFRLSVPNRLAATMFYLNLQTLKENDFVKANFSREYVRQLERALQQLTEETNDTSEITWYLRQIIFKRI